MNIISIFLGIAYFCLGILQFLAMLSGLIDWLGLHWLIAGPLSLFLAYTPLLGNVLGIMGAITAWNWSLSQALILFFGPFVAIVTIAALTGTIEVLRERIR